MTTTIIRGGRVLDVAAHRAEPADVLVDGAVIREIGRPGMAAPEGASVLDARDRLLIPGLINAHTHTYATLFKGSYERMPLDLWLVAMRAPTRALSEELLQLSSQLAAIEMLRTGTTTALDHFFGNPELPASGIGAEVRAMREVGLRHAVAYVVSDMRWEDTLPLDPAAVAAARDAAADVTRRETAQALDGAAAFIEAEHGRHPLTTCLVGPSAAHRCSDELLRGARRRCSRPASSRVSARSPPQLSGDPDCTASTPIPAHEPEGGASQASLTPGR